MYQFTQKHNKIILIVVCVVLLPFVGFSFYPIMNRIAGGSQLHTAVGTFEMPAGQVHAVSRAEFEGAYTRAARTSRAFRAFPIRNVDDAWLHLTQVAEARTLGVRVTDEQVNEYINHEIRKPLGLTTVQQYREWVGTNMRLSPREFEETLREFLMRLELFFLHQSADHVDMNALLEQYREQNRKVTVRTVRVDQSKVREALKPVDFPLKPTLESFYSDPAKKYLLTAKPELMRPRVFEEVQVLYGYYGKFDPAQPAVQGLLKDYQPTPEEISQEYERWKHTLYREEPPKAAEEPKDAKDAKDAEEPKDAKDPQKDSQPEPVKFKPLETVKDDVVRRLMLRKVMEGVLAEAEAARAEEEKAKAAAEKAKKAEEAKKAAEKAEEKKPGEPEAPPAEKKDEPEAKQDTPEAKQDTPEAKPGEPEKTEAPAGLDLRALADKYGLEFQKIGPVDLEEIKKTAPFEKDAPDALWIQVDGLAQGLLSPVDSSSEKLVFLSYLAKDRPSELKPLEAIEDAVREVAMDDAAREKAREQADRFYEAIEAKVVAELEPVLEKEIRAPLRQQKEKEIAAENAERVKQGKPALKAEELETIDRRYEDRIKEREAPRIETAKREKLGAYFEDVAKAENLDVSEFAFYLPWRDFGRGAGRDFERERREIERHPVEGFLKYRAGISALREAGEVMRPAVDTAGKAVYVVKLVKSEPARWEDMDPRTYRRLMDAAQRDQMFQRRTAGDPLSAARLEERYHLRTNWRYHPEAEEGESAPTR